MPKMFFRNIRADWRKAGIVDLDSIVRKEVAKTLDKKVKPALVKSHEKIVQDWDTKISFGARKNIYADQMIVYTWPAGKNKHIWYYVDLGTRPHQIPQTNKLMVFQAGGTYVPKTMANPPRTVVGGGHVKGGTKTVITRRRAFVHPGSKGRGFSEKIAKDILPDFRREVENAFKRAAYAINKGP